MTLNHLYKKQRTANIV